MQGTTKPFNAATTPKAREVARCKDSMRSLMLGYRGWMEEALRREKLTLPQLRMLVAVEQASHESAAALARSCQVTPQTLQAMLERAVREQWIVRSASEHNQRLLTASLTPRGRSILERGKLLSDEFGAAIWKGVSASALQQCNAVLGKGLANLAELVAEQYGKTAATASARRGSATRNTAKQNTAKQKTGKQKTAAHKAAAQKTAAPRTKVYAEPSPRGSSPRR